MSAFSGLQRKNQQQSNNNQKEQETRSFEAFGSRENAFSQNKRKSRPNSMFPKKETSQSKPTTSNEKSLRDKELEEREIIERERRRKARKLPSANDFPLLNKNIKQKSSSTPQISDLKEKVLSSNTEEQEQVMSSTQLTQFINQQLNFFQKQEEAEIYLDEEELMLLPEDPSHEVKKDFLREQELLAIEERLLETEYYNVF